MGFGLCCAYFEAETHSITGVDMAAVDVTSTGDVAEIAGIVAASGAGPIFLSQCL